MAEARPRPPARRRRFYDEVALGEAGEGAQILLDGEPALTPRGAPLVVPDPTLAGEIAEEWRAQGARVAPETMPVTRIAMSAIDQVAGARAAVIGDIVGYAGADLLCYRAAAPEGLVTLQCRHWDPVLDWVADALGARFRLASGVVVHEDQSGAALGGVRAALAPLDAFALAALHVATTLTGSALLALALARRRLDAEAVWAAAHVDEDWQVAQWGEDAEAAGRRTAHRRDFLAAARVLELRAV